LTACSEDELTQAEKEAKETKEILAKVTENYNSFTSKKWALKEYQKSAALEAASNDPDDTEANTLVGNISQAGNFNMEMYFEKTNTDSLHVKVDFNLTDAQVDEKLMEYQDELHPDFSSWGMGFILGKEEVLGQLRRVIASPLAADDLKLADITDFTTGLLKFKIDKANYATLSYDDLVLSQRKLIGGNGDKIYFNEDGTLTVESTSEKYGVSKLIMSEVTE
jgi:hypothetical protein